MSGMIVKRSGTPFGKRRHSSVETESHWLTLALGSILQFYKR
jgi:hypothetical protein